MCDGRIGIKNHATDRITESYLQPGQLLPRVKLPVNKLLKAIREAKKDDDEDDPTKEVEGSREGEDVENVR